MEQNTENDRAISLPTKDARRTNSALGYDRMVTLITKRDNEIKVTSKTIAGMYEILYYGLNDNKQTQLSD